MTIPSRIARKSATLLVAAAVAAGVVGIGWAGSAGAELPKRVATQTATPPPPGSGVTVVVEEPQPIGPRSLT